MIVHLNKISVLVPLLAIRIMGRVTANELDPTNSSDPHIIMATIEMAPFMMKNTTTGEWYGYCMDFFNELIKHLPYNISYEVYQIDDRKFGSKVVEYVLETNPVTKQMERKRVEKWTGLVGDLHSGKADVALAPLSVMAERELAIDYTVPFYDLVGIQILLKRPEIPQDWFKFLTVLDNAVWFWIGVAYFATSFIMFLFDRLSPYSNSARARKLRSKKRRDRLRSEAASSVKAISDNLFEPPTLKFNPQHNKLGDIEIDNPSIFNGRNHLGASHRMFLGSMAGTFVEQTVRPTKVSMVKSSSPSQKTKSMSNAQTQQQHVEYMDGDGALLSNYLQGQQFRKSLVSIGDEFDDDVDTGKPNFGFRDSLWFCITSLTPQGGGEAPQNLSGRIVAGAWWLFCFIIIASYTANLAAFLTVSRMDIPINSLDDLAKQYRIKYSPVDGTAEQLYFERMAYIEEIFYNIWKEMSLNDSLSEEERAKFAVWDYPISDKYTKIWAQIQQVGMPEDVEGGIKRVKSSSLEDGFALLTDANTVKRALMTDCSLKAVGDEFSRKPIALGLRKGQDKFKEDLSHAILQLINQRFMEILREKWWTNNPDRVTCSYQDESDSMGVDNIGGVFIIIFAGVVVSFLFWAVERFLYQAKLGVSKKLLRIQ